MPPGRPELQDFDCADHDDGGDRRDEAIAPIGKSEGEANENEGKRMLAILAEIGVRAVARRSKGREGDGGGETPGNQAKKHCHAIGLAQIGQKYSADTKCPQGLVNAASFSTGL
jgi:hypothetical protein